MEEGKRARGSTFARIRWAAAWLLIVGLLGRYVYWHVSLAGRRDPLAIPKEFWVVAPQVACVSLLIILCVVLLLIYRRRATGRAPLRRRLGAALVTDNTYLEAFALYIGVFTLAQRGLAWIGGPLWLTEIATWSAPMWAVARLHVRKLRVSTMRRDTGLYRGAGWRVEIGAGILALVGIVFFDSLWFWFLHFRSAAQTVEPLPQTFLDTFRVYQIAQAVLWAPLIEEFCFRGLLYRHLRTHHGFWLSALVTTVLFTAGHTQHHPLVLVSTAAVGLLACALREWRGSLIGCITLHACGNSLPFLFAL